MNALTCLLILQSIVVGQAESALPNEKVESYDFEMYKAEVPYLVRIVWNGEAYAKDLRIIGTRQNTNKEIVRLSNNVPFHENYQSVSYFLLPNGYTKYRLELLNTTDLGQTQTIRALDAVEKPSLRTVIENFRNPVDFARLVRMVQDNSTRIDYSGVPLKYYAGSVEEVILKNKHGHCSHYCYLMQSALARSGYETRAYGMAMSHANHAITEVALTADRVYIPRKICVDGNLGIVYFWSVDELLAKPTLADDRLVGSPVKRRFWRYHGSRFFQMQPKAINEFSREEMKNNLRTIIDQARKDEVVLSP